MKKIFLIFPIIFLLVACAAPITADNDLKIKCDNNDGKACVEYGMQIHKNHSEAFKYYEKSCELNNEWGCYQVAMSYKLDYADVKDPKKTEFYLRKACSLADSMESAFACNNLGILVINTSEELKFLNRACDLGDGMGCENIVKKYTKDYVQKPSKALADKIEFFVAKACEKYTLVAPPNQIHFTCDMSLELKQMGGFENFYKKYFI